MSRPHIPLLVLALLALSNASADEKPAADESTDAKAKPRYVLKKEHDPNGIGKFYMDREIAHVMGWQAAGWLDRPEREKEEGLKKMVDSLDLKPGMTVADIGAGSGRISLMMAEKLGPKGKVIAVDIQDEMLTILRNKLKQLKVENVEPHKGTVKSPKLKPESIDLTVMVDVYHEFEFPYEMTTEIAKATKPGGRVVLVEYRMEDPKVPIKLVHKMSEAQCKKELEQPEFGLKWKKTIDVLPWQHIVVFEKSVDSDSTQSREDAKGRKGGEE